MASFKDNLADDVTLEGVVMNGVLRDRDAVLAQLAVVSGFYRDRVDDFSFDAGDYHVEEYTAVVAGRPIKATATMHRNADGKIDAVVVNHRPLAAALTFSRLIAESPIGAEWDRNRFYRPEGQTYQDLLDYSDTPEGSPPV
ncbi:hypothetical protein GCM10011583_24790 [Streptomyces camponoticapitis]|uniref:Uncharacterized protein n=1 Tax=Streptomyces camponoticapitis TaxID=1616125 RepID=A0ABQ2E6V1_9ACTN|nr:hypothetical protein [Streptomyces camponoticapitis]GGJ92334.1 hypothetical protein GCM10011583_24790 [Streptomyces camponoticapitis]